MTQKSNGHRGQATPEDSINFRYCWDHENNAYVSINSLKIFMREAFVDMVNDVPADKTYRVVEEFIKYIEEGATEVYSSSLT